tara:strand:- start:1007 stop:1195 length:189 start_codon:yes stop_codon:yes gene_type:complete
MSDASIEKAWALLKQYRGPEDGPRMATMTSQQMAGYIAEIQRLKEENALLRQQIEMMREGRQ